MAHLQTNATVKHEAAKETSKPRDRLPGVKNVLYTLLLITGADVVRNLKNFKIVLGFAGSAVVFLIASHLLGSDYQQRLGNWIDNQETAFLVPPGGAVRYTAPNGSFLAKAGKSYESPIHPPEPLSVLVKGVDSEIDRPVGIFQHIYFGRRQNQDLFLSSFDTPDLIFMVKIVASLLGLFFAFGSTSRDRDRGLLRMILTTPVRRRDVFLGKALGAFISLFAAFSAAFGVALAYLYFSHGSIGPNEDWVRVLLILAMSNLYGFIFICAGLYLSAMNLRTKSPIVAAFLVWATLTLIVPNLAVLAARVAVPVISNNQLFARILAAGRAIDREELNDYPYARSVFDTPNSNTAVLRRLKVIREMTDDFAARKLDQIDLARTLALFSPSGGLVFGSADLAGTGTSDYRAYLRMLLSGRDDMHQAIARALDAPPAEAQRIQSEVEDQNLKRQRTRQPLTTSLKAVAGPSASLLAWFSLGIFLAYRRFERYDLSNLT